MARAVSIRSAKSPSPVPSTMPTSGANPEPVADRMNAAVFLISSNIFFQFLQKIRAESSMNEIFIGW